MPTCPKCNTLQKRRKDECCPNCGEPVKLYKGFWVSTSDGSPTKTIYKHFLELQKQKIKKRYPLSEPKVEYAVGDAYYRELSISQKLFKKAGGNVALVLQVLDYLTFDKAYAWKNRLFLASYYRDFDTGLAITRAKLEHEKAEEEINSNKVRRLLEQDDIFINAY